MSSDVCFKRPSASSCPARSSLLVWTLASPRTDSWHIGKRRQGNTATNKWKLLFGHNREARDIYINKSILTLPQADFGRLVFCFPVLSCSNSSARPHELHKHTTYVSCNVTDGLLPTYSTYDVLSSVVNSPVLAGFLLAAVPAAHFKRSRIWFL